MKRRHTEYIAPPVLEHLREEEAKFYTIRAGRKVRAVFKIRDVEVDLVY